MYQSVLYSLQAYLPIHILEAVSYTHLNSAIRFSSIALIILEPLSILLIVCLFVCNAPAKSICFLFCFLRIATIFAAIMEFTSNILTSSNQQKSFYLMLIICHTRIKVNIIVTILYPVSYTHLDVYKRQGNRRILHSLFQDSNLIGIAASPESGLPALPHPARILQSPRMLQHS